MFFWAAAALLTFAGTLAVLLPVVRSGGAAIGQAEQDLEVYRDQLAELERDRARGLIAPEAAEEARIEIGRRMIAASRRGDGTESVQTRGGRVLATAAVLMVPLVSWSVYAMTGSPALPAQPLQARLEKSPADSTLAELVARAERHLAHNPDDVRGWDVLAPIYARMGRHADAARAYRKGIELAGSTAERETGLALAISEGNGGEINEEAQAALRRALAADPDNMEARFLLATALARQDRDAEARAAFEEMLADLPADSPWQRTIRQSLRSVAPQQDAETARGPTAADVEATARMSADERAAMIEGMVDGLDSRLRDNPDDPEGWRKLISSYAVLGRRDEAGSALERALAALKDNEEAQAAISDLAASLGLEPPQGSAE